jgi:hypothetical protein
MNLDLTDDETAALAQLLRGTIDEYRYPLSARLAPLKAILTKIEPPMPQPELPPSLKGLYGAFRGLPSPAAGPPMALETTRQPASGNLWYKERGHKCSLTFRSG